jgi:hypothetical protein
MAIISLITNEGVLDQVTKVVHQGGDRYDVYVNVVDKFMLGKAEFCKQAFWDAEEELWLSASNEAVEILATVLPIRYETYFLIWKTGYDWADGYLIVESPSPPKKGDFIWQERGSPR